MIGRGVVDVLRGVEPQPIEVAIEDVDDDAIAAAIADALATDAAARLVVGEVSDDDEPEPSSTNELVIPDDPTVLSYLLSGIVQVELPRRQRLLEADTTVERLEGLIKLLDREVMLLSGRLRLFTPDLRLSTGVRRS